MPCIAFFPWLELKEAQTFETYSLVPYVREKLPGNDAAVSQATFDQLLSSYFNQGTQPIQRCTLLRLQNKELSADLTEDEISQIFEFTELLAASGLSERRYFSGIGPYCNRDLFRLVVQRFNNLNSVGISTRRRDGNTSSIWSIGAYRVYRPEHVHKPIAIPIDKHLLSALLRGRSMLPFDKWEQVVETVLSFNLANTDSPFVPPSSEMILMCGAIERLLGSESKEDDLATRFSAALTPKQPLVPADVPRLQGRRESFKRATTVRDAWIRDFFRLRGNVAHGYGVQRYPSVWSMEEHLLLASFVYSLLLKLWLKNQGLYVLTTDDGIYIDCFEELCTKELFKEPSGGEEEWAWNEVLGDAFIEDWFDRAQD